MPTAEALELAGLLPDGSRFVRATSPGRAWSPAQVAAADVVDAILQLTWCMGGYDRAKVPKPPTVTRPAQAAAEEAARKASAERAARARRTREVVESTEWEGV